MSFIFIIFLFYIGGTFLYTIILSLSEANKAKKRTQNRSQMFPTQKQAPSSRTLTDVEKRWAKKVEQQKGTLGRNASKKQLTQGSEAPATHVSTMKKRAYSENEESLASKRRNRNKDEQMEPTKALDVDTKPKSSFSHSILNRESLAQAMLTKEILDKPLSIRKKI